MPHVFIAFFWTKTSDLFQRWILCNNLLLRGEICNTITAVESSFQPVKSHYAMPLLRLISDGLKYLAPVFQSRNPNQNFSHLYARFFSHFEKVVANY